MHFTTYITIIQVDIILLLIWVYYVFYLTKKGRTRESKTILYILLYG